MVELKDISLAFAGARKKSIAALTQVNAEFPEGEFSVIIGPSGCGKTSLIRIMAGLQKPSGGQLLIKGLPILIGKNKTAVIFQDYGLLPWKTVRANAELPLRLNKVSGASNQRVDCFAKGSYPALQGDKKGMNPETNTLPKQHTPSLQGGVVDLLLSKFGLLDFAKSYPHRLSGGMKQRLAIVRSLVMEPELLLMDEPFSSLDNITREDAQDFFLSIRQELRLTIVMITHSIEEAVYLADTVFVMAGRNPGTIKEKMNISREGESHRQFRETSRFHEYCTSLRKLLRDFSEDSGSGAEE